jgi:hypothetical protein
VAEADLEGLNKMKNSMLKKISLLDKFKGDFEVDIQAVADKINQKIAALKAEVAQNDKIADLVLIEIKALFAASLAKIQFSPQVTQIEPNQKLALVTKTREILIATPGRAGEGPKYQHPQQFDYNNPLSAIHKTSDVYFLFETQDGVSGANPCNN